MRKRTAILAAICVSVSLLAGVSLAQDIYVRGVTHITMRTGPGTDHKIVSLLLSGTPLEMVNSQSDWSEVRTKDGKQGWVLTRFLTEEAPQKLLIENLRKENAGLEKKLADLNETNSSLTQKNKALQDIEKKYIALEKASSEFLALKEAHKALEEKSQEQKDQIETLEANMNNEEKLWFLSGAGVFIVGLILGLSTRKKKRSSLLS